MPSNFVGLLIFTALFIPGFVGHVVRKTKVPSGEALTALTEATTLATLSLACDLATFGIFAFIRWLVPAHTPNVEMLLQTGGAYAYPRIGYIVLWSTGLLIFACILAGLFSAKRQPVSKLFETKLGRFWPIKIMKSFFAPVTVNESIWTRLMYTAVPIEHSVYAGFDLADDTHIRGYVGLVNLSVIESGDRDIELKSPISIISIDGKVTELSGDNNGFKSVILSARQIKRIYLAYLENPSNADPTTTKRAHDKVIDA